MANDGVTFPHVCVDEWYRFIEAQWEYLNDYLSIEWRQWISSVLISLSVSHGDRSQTVCMHHWLTLD
jgi:hypothetical protein